MTNTISELLDAAAARAVPVVRGITDERLDDPTPCAEYDVRGLANHLLQVVINFQAMAAKKDADFSAEPDYLSEGDWRGRFADETDVLVKAWAAPGAEEGTTGSMGMAARTLGEMVLGDLTVHAWDLARATGQEFTPDPVVVGEVTESFAALAPMARKMGAFGEAVTLPDEETASEFDRLLAMTGRNPHWQQP
ncbi:TIGR03086 family metal-binding protein [Streptomyces sp. NBC_01142]|uniref:TIGR03086 family metal-binding protein n=1 Tax=Streptomyces sp. NBC_01142 TaxID=2975865 RepID=UPI0022547472|nr:TIGR03086 family metal-binding protein [Streptomyces sp. NBC_01142]MCX4818569.1 TIGR03086 family metal-binding protein [Streptomyces sp. NBC_01142]